MFSAWKFAISAVTGWRRRCYNAGEVEMLMRYLTSLSAILCAGFLVAAAGPRIYGGLIVHEWGTFTSVAGEDGEAVDWHPLSGPPELPCFVSRFADVSKGSLVGSIRMETPVMYFYAAHELVANVKVRFPHG